MKKAKLLQKTMSGFNKFKQSFVEDKRVVNTDIKKRRSTVLI